MEAATGTDTLERARVRWDGTERAAEPARSDTDLAPPPAPRHRAEPQADALADVAVVVVSYYSDVELARCLTSVASATSSRVRTWVVDNAPDDDLELTRADHRAATVLHPGENLGYGGAVNHAIRRLPDDVEWVLISNPDVRFTSGSLEAMVAHLREHSEVGVVGPRIRTPEGTIYPSARALPSLTTGTGHALARAIWPNNPWSRRYLQHDVASDDDLRPRGVGWLSGACLVVRRSAFDRIGGFDERFFMYFEDVDLCERMHEHRWEVEYLPSAVVAHLGGTSTARESDRMLRAHHRSAYRYLAKRYHEWYWAPLRWAIGGGLALRLGVVRVRAALRG